MKTANFHSILFNDVFHEIKQYLSLDDLYSLRRVSIEIRYFVDTEVNSLTDINLSGSSNCSFQAFNYITSHCKNIVNINLNRCAWLTNELLETIVLKNYKTLQSISLGCCSKLNSNALQPVIINCKKLKKLGLSNNYWLTSGCVTSIAFHLKNLQELDLKSCPILSVRSLDLLLKSFKQLRVLSLASNDFVDDNVLWLIARRQKQLLHLNLFGCNSITDRGIIHIVNHCKKLKTISIKKCYTLTENSMILLRDNKIQHDILYDPKFVRFNSLNTNKYNMSFLTYMNEMIQ